MRQRRTLGLRRLGRLMRAICGDVAARLAALLPPREAVRLLGRVAKGLQLRKRLIELAGPWSLAGPVEVELDGCAVQVWL